MQYSEILRNPHFNNLAAMLRVPFRTAAWRVAHADVPFWTLLREVDEVKTPQFFSQEPGRREFVKRFTALLIAVTTADSSLHYSEADLRWFLEQMDGEHALTVMALLFAWFSAPDAVVTPAEVAAATGTNESTWRNKAARGEIAGAEKRGKQWLLPVSVVRSQLSPELAALIQPAATEEQRDAAETDLA